MWKEKFAKCQQGKKQLVPGSCKPPWAIQLAEVVRARACVCNARRDAELREPQEDAAKRTSGSAISKIKPKTLTLPWHPDKTRSLRRLTQIRHKYDTNTTQIPHRGREMRFTMCENEVIVAERVTAIVTELWKKGFRVYIPRWKPGLVWAHWDKGLTASRKLASDKLKLINIRRRQCRLSLISRITCILFGRLTLGSWSNNVCISV